MEKVDGLTTERRVIRTLPDHPENELPVSDHNDDGAWCDDGSLCDDLDLNEGLGVSSDLDREWRKRHDQFHTIGYRDGLTAGKETSAQEGFNDGFKQSVLVGYKWGLVRGVTSALSCISDDLKAKLVGAQETGEKLQNLYESVTAVSAQDALRYFHAETLASGSEEKLENKGESSNFANIPNEMPSSGQLSKYIGEFESLLESSTIRLH